MSRHHGLEVRINQMHYKTLTPLSARSASDRGSACPSSALCKVTVVVATSAGAAVADVAVTPDIPQTVECSSQRPCSTFRKRLRLAHPFDARE